ncbi:MAG: aldehyde dehydrogenase (NAD+) [Haloarculaceae archaeon]|jgi:aldehyde dehydrogenase (NAD+)
MCPPFERHDMGPNLSPDTEWNKLIIDGDAVGSGGHEEIDVLDPSTEEAFATVPAGSVSDVDNAFEAAVAAQESWAEAPPGKRSAIVSRANEIIDGARDELLKLLATESGSTRVKGNLELASATGIIRESSGFPTRITGEQPDSLIRGKENVVRREPTGVVSVISPWNFPFHLTVRAVAPALALGNAVVLKPATNTPLSGGLAVARIFEAAGLPDGLLNVVTGYGSEIGDRVAGHPDADVVAFTGSTEVGRHVAKQAVDALALPAMELGGNGPHVVLEDADIEQAVAAGAFGSFLHQGQVCISINRHLVHEAIYDEYVAWLVDHAQSLPTGSAHNPDTVVGPVISAAHRDDVLDYVERTVTAGATLETGGGHEQLVVEPTVLSDVSNDMAAACNEHFGPVAPVIPFESDEEAVELANETEYGLAASVFSTDLARAQRIATGIDAGMVHVNDQPINEEPHVAFGGTKSSGIGRYNGDEIARKLTEPKWISTQHEPRRYPF